MASNLELPADDMGIEMPEEDEGISLNDIIGAPRLRPRAKRQTRSNASACCGKNCLQALNDDGRFQAAHARFKQDFSTMSGPEQNHKLFHMLRDADLQSGVGCLDACRSAT